MGLTVVLQIVIGMTLKEWVERYDMVAGMQIIIILWEMQQILTMITIMLEAHYPTKMD